MYILALMILLVADTKSKFQVLLGDGMSYLFTMRQKVSNSPILPVSYTSMILLRLGVTWKPMEDEFQLPVFMCVHLIQTSPDSCCRTNPCSTCSRMERCSVSQEGGLGWSLCTCKCTTHTFNIRQTDRRYSSPRPLNDASHIHVWYWPHHSNSPEKGVLQVQEIAGLWSCLIHLRNNADVVALSVEKEIRLVYNATCLHIT